MGVTSAVGARFAIWGREGKIVDVMINFNYQSLRNTIEPLAFFGDPSESRFGLVRLRAGDIPAALAAVQGIWERVLPRYPFDYQFLDEDFDGMYRSEERMSTLLGYFAVFAVVIACLGLFSLASFTAEQRTKEIGVRKVLGASAPQVVVLLCKEFSVLVVRSGQRSGLSCRLSYYERLAANLRLQDRHRHAPASNRCSHRADCGAYNSQLSCHPRCHGESGQKSAV